MFIHFAFGSLAKQEEIEKQTDHVIELILKEKKIKVSKCKEFIPAYPHKGAKRIPPEMFKVTGEGEVSATFHPKEDPEWLSKLPDDTFIHFLPVDVPMICFTKIPFSKLRNSEHATQYGKFGLVFSELYFRSKGLRKVFYYTEDSLWQDRLIRKWNYEQNHLSEKQKRELVKEITSYRKPASLFSTFKKSVITKITTVENETVLQYLTYNRYPDDYDFSKEKEYRIVFDDGIDYLYFDETDLFMIIVPNQRSKEKVEQFLSLEWNRIPLIEVYPT